MPTNGPIRGDVRFYAALLLGAGVMGCKKTPPNGALPGASATTQSAELVAPALLPARSRTIETVDVMNDRPVLVVPGETARPIIYLHGMCADAEPDLESWASSVSAYGTIIALSGDAPCANRPGQRTWSKDASLLDRRIAEAIGAVARAKNTKLDASEILLIGESMGASRAIGLASRFPAKYARLVLVGGPETPAQTQLGGAKAIALLAGEREPQDKMQNGALGLARAGLNARFWELTDATHGTYGSDGARTMGEAVAFVSAP
jgi:pimeloyl-ACP methyl ester carboxylesterase